MAICSFFSSVHLSHFAAVNDLSPTLQVSGRKIPHTTEISPTQIHHSSECSEWDILLISHAMVCYHKWHLILWIGSHCALQNDLAEAQQMLSEPLGEPQMVVGCMQCQFSISESHQLALDICLSDRCKRLAENIQILFHFILSIFGTGYLNIPYPIQILQIHLELSYSC